MTHLSFRDHDLREGLLPQLEVFLIMKTVVYASAAGKEAK